MPTYEYRCAKCNQHIEVYQSFSEDPLTKHKGCGGKLTKVLSPAGIVLKGSGFYKTDSRSSSSSKSSSKKPDSSKPDSSKSDSTSDSSSSSSSSPSSDSSSSSSPSSSDSKSA